MKNYKEVYLFDDKFFYVGTGKAHKSPLEKDVFLMPANSTDKIPKLSKGKICKFVNEEWVIEEEKKKIDIIKTPEEILNEARNEKKSEINKQRDLETSKPYKFIQKGKTHYLSQDFEKELLWLKSAGEAPIADWVTIDNDIIKISKEEYKEIVVDMGKKTMNRITKARKIKNKITNMSLRDIKNYNITKINFK